VCNRRGSDNGKLFIKKFTNAIVVVTHTAFQLQATGFILKRQKTDHPWTNSEIASIFINCTYNKQLKNELHSKIQ